MIRKYDPYTYKHPRTLIDAFGCDASSACAIIKYKYKFNVWDKLAIGRAVALLISTVFLYLVNP